MPKLDCQKRLNFENVNFEKQYHRNKCISITVLLVLHFSLLNGDNNTKEAFSSVDWNEKELRSSAIEAISPSFLFSTLQCFHYHCTVEVELIANQRITKMHRRKEKKKLYSTLLKNKMQRRKENCWAICCIAAERCLEGVTRWEEMGTRVTVTNIYWAFIQTWAVLPIIRDQKSWKGRFTQSCKIGRIMGKLSKRPRGRSHSVLVWSEWPLGEVFTITQRLLESLGSKKRYDTQWVIRLVCLCLCHFEKLSENIVIVIVRVVKV